MAGYWLREVVGGAALISVMSGAGRKPSATQLSAGPVYAYPVKEALAAPVALNCQPSRYEWESRNGDPAGVAPTRTTRTTGPAVI